MAERIYLYPIWVRLWHVSNAFLFLILIVTGLSMQYSSPGETIVPFEVSVSLHNITGILLTVLFVIFIFGNLFTGNGKYYKVVWKGLISRAKKQFIYYIVGVFKKQDPPFPISEKRKFNPMQLFSYVLVMYLFMPLLIITGLALFVPDYIPTQIFTKSGIHITDLIHIIVGFTLSMFMLIHIYFCTMGKTPIANYKSMIDGWH